MTTSDTAVRRGGTPVLGLCMAVLVAFAGCGDEDPTQPNEGGDGLEPGHALLDGDADIHLDVEGDRFDAGDRATLVLRNESDEQVGYNMCFHALEVRTDGEWTGLDDEGGVCTAVLYQLDPGESDRYDAPLPDDLAPGEYRFRIALYLMGRDDRRDQVSGPFTVDG